MFCVMSPGRKGERMQGLKSIQILSILLWIKNFSKKTVLIKKKSIQRNNGWWTKTLAKRKKLTYSRNWENPKQDKLKYIQKKTEAKLLKFKDKWNILKAPRKKNNNDALSMEEQHFECQQISHQKPWRPEGNSTSSLLKEVNAKFYT